MATTASATDVPTLISGGLVAVAAVFPFLSGLSMYGRFQARRLSSQHWGTDDWWLVIAWITTLALSITVWYFASVTGINHYKISPAKGLENSLMCLVVAAAIHAASVSLVKIGILFFYMRLFPVKRFKVAVYVTMICVACYGAIFFFLMIFQSNPVRGSWTGEGHLIFNSYALGMAEAVLSLAFDVVILTFPVPMVARLNMKPRRKIAVALIFWLGIFCVVAAAIRIYYLNASVKAVISSQGFSAVYLQTTQFMFVIIEPNCSIIAANLPTYGPLVRAGRAPESIIASARSVFSLRSRSRTSSSTTMASDRSRPDSKIKTAEATVISSDDSQSDETYATKNPTRNWDQSTGQNTTVISADPMIVRPDGTGTTYSNNQIMVTRDVEVARK